MLNRPRPIGHGLAPFLAVLLFAGALAVPARGVEPGFEIIKACRANLTMLNEATAQYIKDGNTQLPTWDKFQNVYTMCLSTKYIPVKPVSPTADCEYFLVCKNLENFDWYCNLHGLIGGDKTYTFRYHEYQVTARINTKYLTIGKYKSHADNLLRWCGYAPTLMEDVKYHYARNPFSTLVIVGIGLLFVFFVYRNVFAP
ncbi:MAG: hypothetical protein GX442_13270 [Candidatus Riflebacteria bacterium]|nr:hypothetical protein [Candidatus Riflebacteria bacterium]